MTGAIGVNKPNYLGGQVLTRYNPRLGQPYFNSLSPLDGGGFDVEGLGQPETSNRHFFHGPGLNNYDMAPMRSIDFTDSKRLQMRFEAFNVFNHA